VTPFQQTGEEILADLDLLMRGQGPDNG
jgi:hypothetical protein